MSASLAAFLASAALTVLTCSGAAVVLDRELYAGWSARHVTVYVLSQAAFAVVMLWVLVADPWWFRPLFFYVSLAVVAAFMTGWLARARSRWPVFLEVPAGRERSFRRDLKGVVCVVAALALLAVEASVITPRP